MKTGVLTTQTIVSGDIRDTKSIMGMSAKGMEMAQYFLRDKIYTDKVLAVIREYISNALDEHKKHNIEQDVDVSICGDYNEYRWVVRDYAKGLSDYDVRNIFGVYFESTKSHTNDMIGGFGIGSKAGFSYSDTFYVVSHFEGKKTSYVCTLGSSNSGIPIGEIYEVGSEPTSEQGIEVSLVVSAGDLYNFEKKTKAFIQNLPPDTKIKYTHNIHNEVAITPTPCVLTKQLGEYTITNYDVREFNFENASNHRYSRDTKYLIRMGGVIYPHTDMCENTRKFCHVTVVDVPIGKLTIPVSREHIENTPHNKKTFEEIQTLLDEFADESAKAFPKPKLVEYTHGKNSKVGFDDGWFFYSFSECAPDSYKFINRFKTMRDRLDRESYDSVLYPNLTSQPVYVIPNIQNTNSWKKRIKLHLVEQYGDDYTGFSYISESHKTEVMNYIAANPNTDLDLDGITFVDVKKANLPKVPTTKKANVEEFVVYTPQGYKRRYTAEQLDAEQIDTYDSQLNLDFTGDWHTVVESMNELGQRSIGLVEVYGTSRWNSNTFWKSSSKKMMAELLKLGWIAVDSPEWCAARDRIKELEKLKESRRRAKELYTSEFFDIEPSPVLLSALKSVPKRLEKLRNILDALKKEDSTRGRILGSLSTYSYYRTRKLTRSDFRKILTLKD